MNTFIRVVGVTAWTAAVILTIVLVWSFTSNQGVVPTGVAMLAIAMSATGLLMARHAWQQSARIEFAFGIIIWLGGSSVLTANEIAFWADSYESQHRLYLSQQAQGQRSEGLTDYNFKALITGNAPQGTAEIAALLDAKRLDPAVERSGDCTNFARISRKDAHDACEAYFALKAKLAAAEKLEKMEREIATTKPAAAIVVAKNTFAGAETLARLLGGDPRNWAATLSLLGWLFLMMVRDMGLLVAFPPKRGQREQTPKAPDEAPVHSTTSDTHAASTVTPIKRQAPGRIVATDLPRSDLSRKAPASEDDLPSRFRVKLAVDNSGKAANKRRVSHDLEREQILEWIEECTQLEDGCKATPKQLQASYHAWCNREGVSPSSNKRLAYVLSVERDGCNAQKPKGRSKQGKIWHGLRVWMPDMAVERMVA